MKNLTTNDLNNIVAVTLMAAVMLIVMATQYSDTVVHFTVCDDDRLESQSDKGQWEGWSIVWWTNPPKNWSKEYRLDLNYTYIEGRGRNRSYNSYLKWNDNQTVGWILPNQSARNNSFSYGHTNAFEEIDKRIWYR